MNVKNVKLSREKREKDKRKSLDPRDCLINFIKHTGMAMWGKQLNTSCLIKM